MGRGAFMVFEGLDRSGKSTQVARLAARLERAGQRVRVQKFPDRTTAIGKMIDAYLQSQTELDDRAIHLLFSANRWECTAAIERDLAAGVTVIADRYAFSGLVYSAAKGLPPSFCRSPDVSLPLPDLTLFLTLSASSAAARADFGAERYETLALQLRVREQFAVVGHEVRARHGEGRWVEIPADGDEDDVEFRVGEAVHRLGLGEAELGPLGRLWEDEAHA
ncbi:Thymidylate kinase [Cryptotrichosporon argae]